MEDLVKSIVFFCDGACSGNPGPGGWGAIVYTPDGFVRELGARNPLTTNNQMELIGAIRALEFVREKPGNVFAHTDSTYVINGITKWIFGWRKKGWKTSDGKDIANRELWEKLATEVFIRGKENKIVWRYVRGHAGIPGNDRADEIAVAFAQNQHPTLYSGPLLRYSVPLHDIPEVPLALPEMKSKAKKAQAYSYLSMVGNIPYRHKTWAECERRVKGQSGAKFKKALSPEDEAKILESWGCDPSQLK